MSVIDGKAKNWGSRSGRNNSNQKKSLTDRDRVIYNGLTNEILEYIDSDPSQFLDDVKEIIAKRKSIKNEAKKVGLRQVFKSDNGILYNGDCIKFLEKKVEDSSIDCIFADPPFNLSKVYGKGINDQLKDEEYLEWTRVWLDLCCDKLKEGGSFFIYNIPKWASYISHYLSQKLEFKNWIAVDLTLSMPIPNRLYPSHYSLLYFVKGKRPNHFSPPRLPLKTCVRCGKEQNDYGGYKMKMNPEGLTLRDVWMDIPPVRHKKYKNRDANQLSLKLLDRVLDIATKEGDLVLDPFGGSGTTYVAAELMGRNWIGVELGYCDSIIDRMKNIDSERGLLDSYRSTINTLFTDKALMNRHRHGLPLDNYRVPKEQINKIELRNIFINNMVDRETWNKFFPERPYLDF